MDQFVSLFSKHTHFSTQTIECELDRKPELKRGVGIYDFTIPRHGDMVRSINLKLGFTGIPDRVETNFYFIPPIYMFERFELIVGDTVIETLYPEMINIYMKTFQTFPKLKGTTYLVGSTQVNNDTQAVLPDEGNTISEQNNRYYYIPLPFYFYGNTTQSLPLCAITQQEVVVRCYMRSIFDIVLFTVYDPIVFPIIEAVKLLQFNFDVEYIYLSPQEFKFFTSQELIYPVTQTQEQYQVVTPVQNEVHSVTMELKFINMVSEMFFYVLPERVFSEDLTSNGRMNFVDKNDSGNTTQPGEQNSILRINLECDGQVFMNEDVCDYLFLNKIQFMLNHASVFEHDYEYNDGYVYNYSFALDPENVIPTGSVNFNAINRKLLRVTFPQSSKTASEKKRIVVLARSQNFLRIHEGTCSLIFKNNMI